MKNAPIILFLCFTVALSAQTKQLEIDWMNQQVFARKMDNPTAQGKVKLLNALFDNNEYPILPYDTIDHTFKFQYIKNVPGLTKKEIYERVRQWCALSYNDVEAVTKYENSELGKVIVKGYVEIPYELAWTGIFGGQRTSESSAKCYHTLAFTCIDGKVKIEMQQLYYGFTTYSYTGTIVTKNYSESTFSSFFPIIAKDANAAKTAVSLISSTIKELDQTANSVARYAEKAQKDTSF